MKGKVLVLLLFALSLNINARAQNEKYISGLTIRSADKKVSWPEDVIIKDGEYMLPLPYASETGIAEVEFTPASEAYCFKVLPSGDFSIVDSLMTAGNSCRFKVRFTELTKKEYLRFNIRVTAGVESEIIDIPLQPVTETSASLYVRDNELFIGEERIFEITTNNPDNIIFSNEWKRSAAYDYRITARDGSLFINIIPNIIGEIETEIPLSLKNPILTNDGNLEYSLPPVKAIFVVKTARIRFLSMEPKEFIMNEAGRTDGIELTLDDDRMLVTGKTYRVEDREEAGGPLIAEIFTRSRLANGKMLCILRPYNYHKTTGGYLYIKDGDEARFVTNFSIIRATVIESINILRDNGSWKTGNIIYPGETVEIRLEGQEMQNASFRFEDLTEITADTVIRTENQAAFRIKVPVDIKKKSVMIFNGPTPTGKTLQISEYQQPREFDFITLNFGDSRMVADEILGPVLYEKTIKDIVFRFDPEMIDRDKIHGKQYFDISIRITNRKNELVEVRNFENIVVCPGESSPRYTGYSQSDCNQTEISLNKYLSKKTYNLEDWSKINVVIAHQRDKYANKGVQKEFDVLVKKSTAFDVEVSFPAGLVTISKQESTGEMGFGRLSTISMAMIAQFSFYHPEKIAQFRPYKIGAGFLAFNAFNFSDNADDRDIGLVILGSLYPTTRDVKLSFPLFVGGGYFMKDKKWFFLIGPGIRITL